MPPRHGKSELVSRLFAAYYCYRHPDKWVGVNSYAASLAYTFSRSVRDYYKRAGKTLKSDAAAVRQWETGGGGGLWAAGVGGDITGKGYHLGIIDDPLKNAEQAASKKIREKQKDWFRSTLYTREEPGAALIIIQTRWHQDDLSGWLLSEESIEPEQWHIVNFQALKGENQIDIPSTCTLEYDPRQINEALCPERYDTLALHRIRKRLSSYFWSALYQQSPIPKDGNLFKRDWFEIVPSTTLISNRNVLRVRYWDLASTQDGGDWTVGLRMAFMDDAFYIEDIVRGQWSSGKRNQIIRKTAERDGLGVTQWVEREPGSSGIDAARAFVSLLAGYTAKYEHVTGSKESRADPVSSQAEIGKIKLIKAHWNSIFLDEICGFPYADNDDQVDTTSGAFRKLLRQTKQKRKAKSHST